MTDKMPKVGERYKSLVDGKEIQIIKVEGEKKSEEEEGIHYEIDGEHFSVYGDKTYKDGILIEEKSKSFQNAENCYCNRLEEGLGCNPCLTKYINNNLSTITEINMLEEKPKSIWKDVSELPEKDCQVIVKTKKGEVSIADFVHYPHKNFYSINYIYYYGDERSNSRTELTEKSIYDVESFTYTGDFINHIDSLEQRINQLEKK